MPSSKKTANLFLNRWLGSDKPKKDDFNEDNDILDQSIGALRQRMERSEDVQRELEEGQQNLKEQMGAGWQDWQDTLGEVRQEIKDTGYKNTQSLTIHAANGDMHVTWADQLKWNSMGPVMGNYKGTGTAEQDIVLGFTPKAGFVFAAGYPLSAVVFEGGFTEMWSAMLAEAGGSEGLLVLDNGFRVMSKGPSATGVKYMLNNDGVRYLYAVWR